MPNPNEISRKIDYLARIAIDEYEIDSQWMKIVSDRAKKINERARDAGFDNTDVFMGEDGMLAVSAYSNKKSIGIGICENDYDIYVERERKLIEFAGNKTEQEAFSFLDNWGRLWNSYAFYQDTPMIQIKVMGGSIPLPSGILEEVESRSLIQNAWYPKELIYAAS